MFRAALRANRVARDEELRVGYVALGGGSLGRHAARHAKVHAVFGAQAGGSVERSGLSSVRQSLDPVKRPKRQRLDPANLGKVSFFKLPRSLRSLGQTTPRARVCGMVSSDMRWIRRGASFID